MFGGNNMNLFDMYKENKDVYMVQDGDKDRYLVTYKNIYIGSTIVQLPIQVLIQNFQDPF